MKHSEFVHLHNHSDLSLLDGAQNVDSILETISDLNMDSVGITEHGNMFGAVNFYQKAQKNNIKPIVGCEIYVAKGSMHQKDRESGAGRYNHLVLLAQNYIGYQNLMKIVTHGYLEGFYYKPRVDKEILKKYNEGIICLSGCLKGELQETLIYEGYNKAKKVAEEFLKIFPGRYYIELQNHGIPEEIRNIELSARLAKEMAIPLVATNDAHYSRKEHFSAHDVHICIGTGKQLSEKNRLKYFGKEFYFKSQDEMFSLFGRYPGAIENSRKIVESINLEIPIGSYQLPSFSIPEEHQEKSLEQFLRFLCEKGLDQKYGDNPDAQERLDYELSIISKTGFESYFLITSDFVHFAKSNGIPVGPGRGSAPGSIVSYCLGITTIDPIKYNLLFERFLNPDRISMPDIDIDFCVERRYQVIDYIKKRYGDNAVSQIITFGKMNARAAIRDVGRVMGFPYSEVDKIAKMIPEGPGVTLDYSLKKSSDFRTASQSNYKELIENAQVLEGMVRHASTHAAGVVVAPKELTELVPLYRSSQGEVTTQYDMKELEAVGLLKMDFLGLRNLTVIDKTIKLISEIHGKNVDIDTIELSDQKVFSFFSKGLTVGVFQFESSGMREYLKKLKPKSIEDLVAMNALYRPGPMQNIDRYINRAHGKEKIEYVHPELKNVLQETYGIIVYQEQVMQIANIIAGFTLSEADEMRRAIGKKIRSLMDKMSTMFVEGAIKKGVPKSKAVQIFELIDKFAQYGFNKSHSVAYSLIAYQTAWLKAHYTAEFMSANLTSEMNNTDRVVVLINDCRKLNIEISSPNINESGVNFYPISSNKISFGLNAIKNVGVKALEGIVDERRMNGKFLNIFDFISRIDQRLVNKKVLESLIDSGSFDALHSNRAQLFESVDLIISYGQQAGKNLNSEQFGLFDQAEEEILKTPDLPNIKEWEDSEKFSREKNVLGMYLTGNPLLKYGDLIEEVSNFDFIDKQITTNNKEIIIGGAVSNLKLHYDKKGQQMAFFNLDCLGGQVEAVIFHDSFATFKELISENNIVFLKGSSTDENDFSDLKMIVNEVVPVQHAKKVLKLKDIHIKLDKSTDKETMQEVANLAKENKGDHRFIVHIEHENKPTQTIVSEKIKVSLNNQFIVLLKEIAGQENVWLED